MPGQETERNGPGSKPFEYLFILPPRCALSPSFHLFLLNSDVLGTFSCLTSTRQRNQRERDELKGTNTFDRLTQDEPWGHSKTAFDTDAYFLGFQLSRTHVTATRALRCRPKKTDVFTSREERRMPKNFTTSASERDYISLLLLGYTWPWGSVIRGLGEKTKSLQCEWNAQHLMYAQSPFFNILKIIVIRKRIRIATQITPPHPSQ